MSTEHFGNSLFERDLIDALSISDDVGDFIDLGFLLSDFELRAYNDVDV